MTVRDDFAPVVVPQTEDEVAEFNWDNLNSSHANDSPCSFSVIDEYTRFIGKLIARNVFIHGNVEGLVFAENVTIERSANVKGVIFCRALDIFGRVNANIVCDRVFIRSSGHLMATLKYKILKIAHGGSVTGKLEKRYSLDRQVWGGDVTAKNDFSQLDGTAGHGHPVDGILLQRLSEGRAH